MKRSLGRSAVCATAAGGWVSKAWHALRELLQLSTEQLRRIRTILPGKRQAAALLLAAVIAGCAESDRVRRLGEDATSQLASYVETCNLPSLREGRSELYVIVDVVYADLQFIRLEGRYRARLESSIALLDTKGAEVIRDASRQILVDDFAETASKQKAERIAEVFDLSPGTYQLVVTVTDQNSLVHSIQKSTVQLKDFGNRPLAVSDILFFEHAPDSVMSPLEAIPAYPGSYPEKFYAVAELTSKDPGVLVEVAYRLSAPNGRILQKGEFTQSILRDGYLIQIEVKNTDLRIGTNQFKVEVRSGKDNDESEREFFVRWSGLPRTAGSLDQAIEQLRYVAPRDEWEAMRETVSEKEKKRLFEDFWERRDPTPGTPANELQEEYYTRVAEANQRFSEGATLGWETDRGRVYITYGPPDYVTHETSQHDFATSYEVWYYQQLGQRFIFRDYGGGRYMLTGVRGA